MDPVFFYVAVFWVLPVIAGYLVGQARGRTFQGVVLPLFFSYLGLLVVAVLPPTVEKRREEEERLTRVIANAGAAPAAKYSSDQAAEQDLRVWATAEAVRRDPSLGENQDPESLQRLREAVEQVIAEKRTLDDLNAVKSREAAEEAARRAAELAALKSAEESRRDEDHKAWVRARQEEEAQAERDRLAAMSPLSRWISTHQGLVWGTGISVVVLAAGLGIVALNNRQEMKDAQAAAQAQEVREAAEAEAAAEEKAEAEAEYARCDPLSGTKDLTGCEIVSWRSLAGATLRNVDFTGADLSNVRLNNADLSGSIFDDARLAGASLRDADLTNTDWDGASGGNFFGADVSGADFGQAPKLAYNLELAAGAYASVVSDASWAENFGYENPLLYDDATIWPKGFDEKCLEPTYWSANYCT